MPCTFCKCHYHLGLSSFIPAPFLPLLCRILLPLVSGNVCLLWRETCVGFWACITSFIPSWNGHCPDKGLYPYSPLGSYSCHSSYSSHGPAGCYSYHVGPLGLLPFFLGFPGPLISSLPLILPKGLLAVILVMLAHWACHLFSRPIGLATSFLGLPQLTYFVFTSYSFHGSASCYSCHVGPLGLLPLFLGFLDSLTSFLPHILPMDLLAVIPTMLAHWAYYLFSCFLDPLLHLYLLFFPWIC